MAATEGEYENYDREEAGYGDESGNRENKIGADDGFEYQAGDDKDDDKLPNKIFCGGISWNSTEEGLKAYFSKFGEVTEVILQRDPTGRPRGFAFVSFSDSSVDAAEKATIERYHRIDDKDVEVKPAVKRPHEREGQKEQFAAKLFVGGISPDTTDDDLKEHFAQFGEVSQTSVMYDPVTTRSRGFGFVTFVNKEDAEKCLRERHHEIKGRTTELKSYRARPPRGSREFGGGRGGYRGGFRGGYRGGYQPAYQPYPYSAPGAAYSQYPNAYSQYPATAYQASAYNNPGYSSYNAYQNYASAYNSGTYPGGYGGYGSYDPSGAAAANGGYGGYGETGQNQGSRRGGAREQRFQPY